MGAEADRRPRLRSRTVVAGAVSLAVPAVVFVFVAEPVRVPSASMDPTFRPGDHVLVDKLAYRDAAPQRRELVVAKAPDSVPGGGLLLKRLVAVGGDVVGLEDGVLVVNGRPVHEPFYEQRALDGVYFGPVTVPHGSVFLLGDNWADSTDSRNFGPVPVSTLVGRVRYRLWPGPGSV